MSEIIGANPENPSTPEVLTQKWDYLVVDPYSINVKTPEIGPDGVHPPQFGEERLSFYSAFIISTAYEMWRRGQIDKIVLMADDIFYGQKKQDGSKYKSTGQLMRDFLTRDHGVGRPAVPDESIVLFNDPDLNQTATQLRKLSEEGIGKTDQVLYLAWGYHAPRVRIHSQGYEVNSKLLIAEDMWKELNPQFNLEKLREVLDERKMRLAELPRIIEALFDQKGKIPMKLKGPKDGVVVDIQKQGERVPGQPRKLEHVIIPGKIRLQILESN